MSKNSLKGKASYNYDVHKLWVNFELSEYYAICSVKRFWQANKRIMKGL